MSRILEAWLGDVSEGFLADRVVADDLFCHLVLDDPQHQFHVLWRAARFHRKKGPSIKKTDIKIAEKKIILYIYVISLCLKCVSAIFKGKIVYILQENLL